MTATALILGLGSAPWRATLAPPRAPLLEATRLTNHRLPPAIKMTTIARVEAMSEPSLLSTTRRVTSSIMNHLRGRRRLRRHRLFPFQTFHQSSAFTLLRGRLRSSGPPDLHPRSIPTSALQKCVRPRRVRISRLVKFVGVRPLQIMELRSVVADRK